MTRIGTLACALLLGLQATPVLAGSGDPVLGSSHELPKIDLVIVGDAREYSALQERIVSWFQPHAAAIRATRRDSLDGDAVLNSGGVPGIRIWIVLRSAMRVRLHFMVQTQSAASQHYLVRDLDLERGLDELGLEQVAQIVYLSAVALWEGGRIDPRLTATFDAALPVVSAKRLPPPAIEWLSGAEYGARYCGPEGIAHGPGVVLGATLRRADAAARLHIQMLFLRQLDATGVALNVQGLSLRVGPALTPRLTDRLTLDTEVGLGLDMTQASASPGSDRTIAPSRSSSALRPYAYLQLGVDYGAGGMRVGIAAALVVQFLRTHYDVVDADQRVESLVPWLAQPGLFLTALW